jgi:hypothetical protein
MSKASISRVIINSLDVAMISAVTAAVLLGTSAAYAAVPRGADTNGDGRWIELIEGQAPSDRRRDVNAEQAIHETAKDGTWKLAVAIVTGRTATKSVSSNLNTRVSPNTKSPAQPAR